MAIAPALEAALIETDSEDILDELKAEKKRRYSDEEYPKPDIGYIQEFVDTERSKLQAWRDYAERERERRFLRDETPLKLQQDSYDGRRFYSKLTDNEINRVVALQMTNAPKIVVPAAGNSPTARKSAERETRWANQVLPTVERVAGRPIRRRVVDCQNESGRSAYEVYLTGSYDDLDLEPRVIEDPKTGELREETKAEVMKRVDGDLHQRRPPFGIRYIDGLTLYYREDEDGICEAAIVESKPVPQVRKALRKAGKDDDFLPKPGDPGWPRETPTPVPTVETIRFYDRRWYAWCVGDRIVDGPHEHYQPGVPVFPVLGMVTGAADAQYQARGICAGLESIELGINDLMTIALDNSRRYSRPKFIIETPENGTTINGADGQPAVLPLDLSNRNGIQQLKPGQRLINVTQGWEPYQDRLLVNQLQQMWEHNGINPVLQGESPGAAAAGYTVNALQGSASRMYEDNISNEATAFGKMIDHIRLLVRDTIEERVPLAAPMGEGAESVEWLDLTPDEVTEVPAMVTIDSTSDANRLAKRESLQQAWKEGVIKKSRLQTEGFGIDDPDAEDDQIMIDKAIEQMFPFLWQSAFERVRGVLQPQQPQGSGLVDQQGNPLPPSGGGGAPGQMAPPNPPSVGAGLNAASQGGSPFETRPGPAALPAATARAGQGRNYVPQPGRPG